MILYHNPTRKPCKLLIYPLFQVENWDSLPRNASTEAVIWTKVCTPLPLGCATCCFSATSYLILTHHSCPSGAGEILILSSNFRPRPSRQCATLKFNKSISFVRLMIKMLKRPGPKIELSIITVVHYPEFPGKSFSIYHESSFLHLNSEYQEIPCQGFSLKPTYLCWLHLKNLAMLSTEL